MPTTSSRNLFFASLVSVQLIFIFMLLEPTMQACKVFVQLILDFYAS
jgi:hypothetical protein